MSSLATLLAHPAFVERVRAQVIAHAELQHADLYRGNDTIGDDLCEYEISGKFEFGEASQWCIPFTVEGGTEVTYQMINEGDEDEEAGPNVDKVQSV